ncbi:hypothetical protein [Companilactobacillus farciminis]|uniref:hypothetical protein n=1 Tax=Companilactobacillus farciminis TaxID=1612 RepID=UPI001915EDA1|nr:hypothetical protein [Companilactobacillus farciminis]
MAEAKVLYNNGGQIFITDSLQKIAEKYQKDAMIQDPSEEQILSYLDMPVPTNWNEYPTENKRYYFNDYMNDRTCVDMDKKPVKETTPIDQVTTNEILQVAFHISNDQLISASRGNVGKQISDVMNSLQDTW